MTKVVCRTIIPTAFAGNIFGKGGNVLNDMRDTFSSKISIPNTNGPERNAYVESSEAKNVASCTVAIAMRISGDMRKLNKSLAEDDIEIRMLLHTSQAGHIIGHKGDNISKLRRETKCRIKLYSQKCPESTDRICQLSGTVDDVTDALDRMLEDLQNTPLEGNVIQYDANNYREREDYGGFRAFAIEQATGKITRKSPNRNWNNNGGGRYGGGYGNNFNDNNQATYGRYNSSDRINGQGINTGYRNRNYQNRNGQNYRDNFRNRDGGYRRNDDPREDFYGRKNYNNSFYQGEDPNEEDKVVCRFLIPSKLAGALIGKGGEVVNKMRLDFDSEISIPTSTSGERTCRVMSEDHKNVVNCIRSMLDEIGDDLRRAGRLSEETNTEIRMLMHTSHAGYVIGQGGKNIKSLRTDTGCRIIMHTEHCPYSTDRICQISGNFDQVQMCVDRVLIMIDETPIKGEKKRYNANFATDKIDYGGFRIPSRRQDNFGGNNFRNGSNRINNNVNYRNGDNFGGNFNGQVSNNFNDSANYRNNNYNNRFDRRYDNRDYDRNNYSNDKPQYDRMNPVRYGNYGTNGNRNHNTWQNNNNFGNNGRNGNRFGNNQVYSAGGSRPYRQNDNNNKPITRDNGTKANGKPDE